MRKIALAICLLLVVAASASAAAAPIVKRAQRASAMWLVKTTEENVFTAYYADVMLDEAPAGGSGWDAASVGKGRCVQARHENGRSLSCRFRGWAQGPASENFQMDPAMNTAELHLTRGKEKYSVVWTAGQDVGIYEAWEGCFSVDEDGNEEEGEGQGGGLLRPATAEAHIFDNHLETNGFWADAMLMSGAMVTECGAFPSLAGLRPGETTRVSF